MLIKLLRENYIFAEFSKKLYIVAEGFQEESDEHFFLTQLF